MLLESFQQVGFYQGDFLIRKPKVWEILNFEFFFIEDWKKIDF
jgi:hypothetical protein